jgi:hypothetical protein
MPAEYRIDVERGVVYSRAWGELTDDEMLEHQRRLGSDPAFDPALNQLFDFQEVTHSRLTNAGIRTLAKRNLFRAGSRRMFAVRPDALVIFGSLRMFELLTEASPDELRVQCVDLSAARAWVGAD